MQPIPDDGDKLEEVQVQLVLKMKEMEKSVQALQKKVLDLETKNKSLETRNNSLEESMKWVRNVVKRSGIEDRKIPVTMISFNNGNKGFGGWILQQEGNDIVLRDTVSGGDKRYAFQRGKFTNL